MDKLEHTNENFYNIYSFTSWAAAAANWVTFSSKPASPMTSNITRCVKDDDVIQNKSNNHFVGNF